MKLSLIQVKSFVNDLDSSKQVEGLIMEYLVKYCDMRNHKLGTYYDHSAKHGVVESSLFDYVKTEAKSITFDKFKVIIDLMIADGFVVREICNDVYYHLNIDLDNPFDYQTKAGINRTIVNKLYGGMN